MRGGIATFAETIVADRKLNTFFDMQLLNTARTGTRRGGRLNVDNVVHAVVDAGRTFRAARRADLVHLQLVADPGLPCIRAAALNVAAWAAHGATVVAHIHSAVGNAGRPELASYGRLDRVALRTLGLASLVCTVSSAGAETISRLAGSTPVKLVDNAVDVAQFTAGSNGSADARQGDVPTVLFVGVLCRRKGALELARASRMLREQGLVDWRLVVVGGQGPTPPAEYAEIVAEFAAAGLSDALVGPEHGEQVRQRLHSADIFVLPSYLEGQPIAIIEAMASGVPVVGSSVGAVPDLIRDTVEGRIVEPGDVDALAEALRALLLDPSGRARMGAAARARAEQSHDLDQLAERLRELYSALLSARRRVAPRPRTVVA